MENVNFSACVCGSLILESVEFYFKTVFFASVKNSWGYFLFLYISDLEKFLFYSFIFFHLVHMYFAYYDNLNDYSINIISSTRKISRTRNIVTSPVILVPVFITV